MALLKFDRSMKSGGRNGESTISFNHSGIISISKMAAEALGMKTGQCWSIFQDDQIPEDWYLSIDKDEGFELRIKDDSSYTFNCSAMVQSFFEAFDYENTTGVTCKVAQEPVQFDGVDFFAIITSNPRIRKKKD